METAKTVKGPEKRANFGLWAMVMAVFVLGTAGQARAAGVNIEEIKPLAPVEFLPKSTFEEATQLISEIPFGDETLAYTVRLPKGWTAEEAPPGAQGVENLSRKVLGNLARYVSPQRLNLRSYFTLEALEQTYEISAKNWLINYLFNNGYTLSSLTEHSERDVEAMYVEIQGDTTYAVRLRAFVNGPRIVVARYFVPQEDYQTERVTQAQSIASFTLPHSPEGGIEQSATFAFMDQSYFDYPASWTLSAPTIKSIERMRAMLYTGTIEGKPEGQINVYVTSRLLGVSLSSEVKRYRDKLIDIPGYALGDRIESYDNVTYNKDITFGAMEAYHLNPTPVTMMPYELVVAVMQSADYYYMVTLLTPARTAEFYIWSRNMRAFRIVAETMRLFNTDADYYAPLKEGK